MSKNFHTRFPLSTPLSLIMDGVLGLATNKGQEVFERVEAATSMVTKQVEHGMLTDNEVRLSLAYIWDKYRLGE